MVTKDKLNNIKQGLSADDVKWFQKEIAKTLRSGGFRFRDRRFPAVIGKNAAGVRADRRAYQGRLISKQSSATPLASMRRAKKPSLPEVLRRTFYAVPTPEMVLGWIGATCYTAT